MKRIISLSLTLAVLAMFTFAMNDSVYAQGKGKAEGKSAQLKHGPFDEDGDGIPNGQDPDYVKPRDGSGNQFGKLNRTGRGRGFGPGDGSGTCGIGPRDGSGFGSGSGTCDGTGPKGRGGPRK